MSTNEIKSKLLIDPEDIPLIENISLHLSANGNYVLVNITTNGTHTTSTLARLIMKSYRRVKRGDIVTLLNKNIYDVRKANIKVTTRGARFEDRLPVYSPPRMKDGYILIKGLQYNNGLFSIYKSLGLQTQYICSHQTHRDALDHAFLIIKDEFSKRIGSVSKKEPKIYEYLQSMFTRYENDYKTAIETLKEGD